MEIEISGQRYTVGKMDAFKQYHVARKLAPALFALGGVAAGLKNLPKDDSGKLDITDDKAMIVFGPVAQALAGMSEDDSNSVLRACLGVCSRAQGAGWAKVLAPGETLKLMFEDIDLSVMFQLAMTVIQENLGNFFPAPPAES